MCTFLVALNNRSSNKALPGLMIELSGSLASILDSEEEGVSTLKVVVRNSKVVYLEDGISPEESDITDPEQVLEAFTLLLEAKAANAEGEGADVGEEGAATGEKTADTEGENTGNIEEAAAAGGESVATGEKTADIREENTGEYTNFGSQLSVDAALLISYNSQGEDPI
ncbi:hypothetical protein BO71DRAFT_414820 [Aspergillus ellipticus CBS 707.79]|uniref:Uncharacterized protein n=1 Tax=Aspergillus ellipticus CBS 707.79 TaxID=1448320 RepID=A0A319CS35_9EURO|nr:hypothetical protein BO71DRAFT_414820 [Aspergillus ellipticus CBS 707.79]